MKRSGDVKWGQIQIGAVVVVAIGFLLWASMRGGDAGFILTRKNTVRAYFRDVKGLVVGAPVRLNGYEVGEVEDISFERFAATRQIVVSANINRSTWPFIRKDSEATIVGVGFFGDKFLAVSAGSPDSPQLQDDGVIAAEEGLDPMEELTSPNGPLTRVGPIMAKLDSIATFAVRGRGSVGMALRSPQLYDQMVALSGDLRRLSASLNQSQERAAGSVVRMSNSLDSLAHSLQGPGTIGLAMRDPALYEHATSASVRLDSVMGEIAAGRGNVGKLTRDEALYQQLQSTLTDVRNILKDLQANPKKYLKVSIF